MKRKLEIKLYTNEVTNNELDRNLTGIVQNLRFGTKLNGGFTTCNFQLRTNLMQGWDYLTRRMFYRLVIYDVNKIVWEGRIQDVSLTIGSVDITVYGYYASLNDGTYNTAYNNNADVVIKAILTDQCPKISSDQSHIQATGGPAITSAGDESYLDKSPRELIEKLASFGDMSGNTWFFAIWENRTPYFFKKDTTGTKWYVRLQDFARFKLTHRGSNLWNKVYAAYTSGGILTRTADASDATSQTRFGVTRYYAIPNLGEVSADAATAKRDTWLADHKDIYPNMDDIALGDFVEDINGTKFPSSYVRAGDILIIRNLVPITSSLGSVVRDALRTFYIMETNYVAERGENRLVLERESSRLDALLGRTI